MDLRVVHLVWGSESILEFKTWILYVMHFYIGGQRSFLSSNMDASGSALPSRGPQSILELKIWTFHAVHLYIGGWRSFWSSRYGFTCSALLSWGSESIPELKRWILHVVLYQDYDNVLVLELCWLR